MQSRTGGCLEEQAHHDSAGDIFGDDTDDCCEGECADQPQDIHQVGRHCIDLANHRHT